MVNTYKEHGEGRVKVFFLVDEDEIKGKIIGNQAISNKQGFQFYVDDYVATQLDKCEFYLEGLTPKLRLKAGEELDVPDEVEKRQREIEVLESKLKQLKAE